VKVILGDVPAIALLQTHVVVNTSTVDDWFAFPTLKAPEKPLDAVKGKFVQIAFPAEQAIDVAPITAPVTVTRRPTFVYVPFELNAPTTVNPPPWFGVQVPSS
jgi:hypothetical protein